MILFLWLSNQALSSKLRQIVFVIVNYNCKLRRDFQEIYRPWLLRQ